MIVHSDRFVKSVVCASARPVPTLGRVNGSDQRVVAWMLGAFVVTFLVTRLITRLIRAGRGPFRDLSVGGVHLHHQVFGIFLLLFAGTWGVAFLYLHFD